VRDLKVMQPFWLRICRLGNIVLISNDQSHPVLFIEAIPSSTELRDTIRHYVELCRDRKGVRQVDV
jgi:hypothetical protein